MMTGKSNFSSDVQRADGWCEFGTSASSEWPRELCSENPETGWVGNIGDSTVIRELDIKAGSNLTEGCVSVRVELAIKVNLVRVA